MKNNSYKLLYKTGLFYLFILFGLSCSGNDDSTSPEPEVVFPTNLVVNFVVNGQDSSNPNGDGSGKIICTAAAKDAIKYGLKIGTETEIQNTTGNFEHTFTKVGTNDYAITVYAYSKDAKSINEFKTIKVYVKPPEYTLVWSDEFDVEGAVSEQNWKFETVPPNNGSWWNGEKQHYTDRLDNAYVSDGTLKITAKKETFTYNGSTKNYTSARLNSKHTFTYGRLDVRAKLPKGDGTWPAIWMLGANFNTVGWPACGEIDIMEHWGHIPAEVSSATHTPACSGGCSNVRVGATILNDYDKEFHVYSVEWTSESLRFLIDGEFKYAYSPSSKNSQNWPYTADQFIILNVAMGGDWFVIDPNFDKASMEIDYVRLYQ
jgi:beta-glucanase (GH16 family)